MKEELLLSLSNILEDRSNLIKFRVNEVYQIRQQLESLLTDGELVDVTNKIRERVQEEALNIWKQNKCKGAILMATGVGKTKVGIYALERFTGLYNWNILIVVPTEKLRDNGWPDEIDKWGTFKFQKGFQNYKDNVTITCYASLSKIKDKHYDLIILDEGHNITDNNAIFFKNNEIDEVMWLSATKPSDNGKKALLKQLNINPIYEITLDEAQKLGLVSPFDITIVTTELDSTDKYIKGGNKEKGYFLSTELSTYQFHLKRVIASPGKQARLNRMRFIYDLKSKTKVAKWILDNIIPEYLRTLIFCGGKKQAIELCDYHYFSRPTKPKTLKGENNSISKVQVYLNKVVEYESMMKHYQADSSLNDFKKKEINRLSCVEALN